MQKALMLVLAGVAIGLLVAPDKGAATQRKVSNWLIGKTDDAKNFLDDAADEVGSKANLVKNNFEDAKEDVKNEFQDKAKR